MSYARTTWSNGDTITATKLNNIETGILGNETAISDLDTAIQGDITDLKEDFNHVCSVSDIAFTQGGYIATNGSVGSVVSLTPNSNGAFQYAIVDCTEGDKFTINGQGWTTGRLWCFIDSDNKLLKAANASVTVTDFVLEAPENSAKLILNMWINSAGSCYNGEPLPTQSELDNTFGFSKITWTTGYYIATNIAEGSAVSLTPTANGALQYAIVNCSEGDKFIVNGQGWTTGRLFCFIDSDNKVLWKSDASKTVTNLELIAPTNSAKAIFNMFIGTAGTSYKGVPFWIYKDNTNALIKNSVNYYSGFFPFQSGIMTITREIAANVKRATTGIVHLTDPFTVSIGSGWQMLYLVGDEGGELTDKGWTIVNGGSHHFTLDEGEYFSFNLAKTSLTDIDASTALADSQFRLIIDDTNDEYFSKSIVALETAIEESDLIPIYYVDINGSGDYTSILEALKSTPDLSHIIVRKGTYDMQSEYEDYYGSDYFTNYSGYDLTDIFSRGYFIDAGRIFECEAGAKIVFRYEGSNTSVSQQFSVINTGMNATIKGCHIYYKNLRYAIHDDYALNNIGTNYYENIIIEGYPSSATGNHWGGGCGKECTYIIKNVVFLDDEMPSNYGDIYYHNNEASGAVNRIVMNNCYGERGCQMVWLGQSTEISYTIVSGCKFESISIRANSASEPYENMKLIKFNNTETN